MLPEVHQTGVRDFTRDRTARQIRQPCGPQSGRADLNRGPLGPKACSEPADPRPPSPPETQPCGLRSRKSCAHWSSAFYKIRTHKSTYRS